MRPSFGFCCLIGAFHGALCVALWQMGGFWLWLLPIVLAVGAFHLLKQGLLLLNRSVDRVWLSADGWRIRYRNQQESGPFVLSSATRLDSAFVRLSFVVSRWQRRHLIVTAAMVGPDGFRDLQAFLRWSPNPNQSDQASDA